MSWLKLGTLRKGKEGKLYLKFDEDVTLKKGDVVQLQDPRKSVGRLQEKGFLDEAKAAERLAKIPDYIRYEMNLPPKK